MPKITKLRLHLLKLFRENYWFLLFQTWCIKEHVTNAHTTDNTTQAGD